MMRSILFLAVAITPALAQPSTPQPGWPVTQGDALLRDFKFSGGGSLPELKVHYRTLGTPRRDAHGRVTNAVMLLHGTSGSGAQFLNPVFSNELFPPGQPLDIAKYYVIMPDGIGHGDSSKPSDGLHAHFPRYGYADMVEAQRRMLVEGLGVDRLRLLLGTSMGCMHAYVWAETHPEFLQAAMPLACLPMQISGRNLAWRMTAIEAIRNDPDWRSGDYTAQPPGLRTALSIIAFVGGNPLTWQKAGPDREKALDYFHRVIEKSLRTADANDIMYAVDASHDYDPAPGLAKITTPMMHINFTDDTINPPELHIAETLLKQTPTVTFELYPYTPDTVGHGSHTKAALWKDRLVNFLRATER
jgi:homoserine O-acetyltransferase